MRLPVVYEQRFSSLLEAVASAPGSDPNTPVVPFWPLRGSHYDSESLVIGRSVNGWVQDWTLTQLRDPIIRRQVVTAIRRDAEPTDQDRMGWVEDLWGATEGYNTRRSAFCRALRRLVGDGEGRAGWAGILVWTTTRRRRPRDGTQAPTYSERSEALPSTCPASSLRHTRRAGSWHSLATGSDRSKKD
jgi:hypothetical protein